LERGVVDRFLVSPAKRSSLIIGRLLGGVIVIVIQSLILIGLALAIGARFPGGAVGVAVLIASAAVLGNRVRGALAGLALVLGKEESVIGAVQFLLLPLMFLSTVFMQRELMPGWIRSISRFWSSTGSPPKSGWPAALYVLSGDDFVRRDPDGNVLVGTPELGGLSGPPARVLVAIAAATHARERRRGGDPRGQRRVGTELTLSGR
jgi:ABC-type multidrug transport system permease subunit